MRMRGKRGQMWSTMIPWIIGIAVLVLVSVFAYFLKDELLALGGRIHTLFR